MLVALLTIADERVRERVGGVTTHAVSHHVVEETSRAESASHWVRDLATQNGVLTLVVLAAAVLVVGMLRV